ncbi:Arabidopsis protein of unknown function (DUF241 [Striga hermonthica]|uniref:Uncharacterized protein n=1 Tax=Striga hermonthica TaxID=68872 RepID=A0A9N7MG91_STRHE|nr:Arabidopsis protein of unknown function (DUF241 [Striga hermonthica]
MAFSPMRSKASNHTRSLSLPSKSNPVFAQFEEALSNMRKSESSCSSILSMNNSLVGLKHLYSKIDDLLQSTHVQQIISRESHVKLWADRVLDGHITLLDACTTAKDHVLLAKQGVQQLLSAVKRKDSDSIRFYLDSRRKSKKMIRKSLKESRSIVSRARDGETVNDLACMLNEAELISVKVLESLLTYLIGTNKVQTRWALVSKMMSSKKIASCQNEFEKIDVFLQSSSLGDLRVDEEIIIMSELKRMDSSIQNLEEELDCLFRQLIKTRVLLLNLLNN